MAYAISVRDCSRENGECRLLARDIPNRRMAETLARNIAASFREYGFEEASKTHWFLQNDRRLEIFAWRP